MWMEKECNVSPQDVQVFICNDLFKDSPFAVGNVKGGRRRCTLTVKPHDFSFGGIESEFELGKILL